MEVWLSEHTVTSSVERTGGVHNGSVTSAELLSLNGSPVGVWPNTFAVLLKGKLCAPENECW